MNLRYSASAQSIESVLSFLSSRPYWDSPNPSHAGQCVPPSPVPRVSTLAWGRGGGGSQLQRGDRHCGTLGIYVLCGLRYESHELHSYTLRYGQSPSSLQLKQRTSRHSKGDQVYWQPKKMPLYERPEAEFLAVIGTKVLRVSFLPFTVTSLQILLPSPSEPKWFETDL